MVVKACGSTKSNKNEQLSRNFSSLMQGLCVCLCIHKKVGCLHVQMDKREDGEILQKRKG